MNVDDLRSYGFDVVGGMVDRRGKNYGRLLDPLRAELTPEGEALVRELRLEVLKAEDHLPARKPHKKKDAEPSLENLEI